MRCFIGLPVPEEAGRALLRGVPEGAGRQLPLTDLHLTLAFLGERELSWTQVLCRHLESILAEVQPLSLKLAHGGPFPSSGSRLWAARALPSPALMALYERIWRPLEDLGVERDQRGFQPHVTLARGHHRLTTKRANESAESLYGDHAEFDVYEVVLYESRQGYRARWRQSLKSRL